MVMSSDKPSPSVNRYDCLYFQMNVTTKSCYCELAAHQKAHYASAQVAAFTGPLAVKLQ